MGNASVNGTLEAMGAGTGECGTRAKAYVQREHRDWLRTTPDMSACRTRHAVAQQWLAVNPACWETIAPYVQPCTLGHLLDPLLLRDQILSFLPRHDRAALVLARLPCVIADARHRIMWMRYVQQGGGGPLGVLTLDFTASLHNCRDLARLTSVRLLETVIRSTTPSYTEVHATWTALQRVAVETLHLTVINAADGWCTPDLVTLLQTPRDTLVLRLMDHPIRTSGLSSHVNTIAALTGVSGAPPWRRLVLKLSAPFLAPGDRLPMARHLVFVGLDFRTPQNVGEMWQQLQERRGEFDSLTILGIYDGAFIPDLGGAPRGDGTLVLGFREISAALWDPERLRRCMGSFARVVIRLDVRDDVAPVTGLLVVLRRENTIRHRVSLQFVNPDVLDAPMVAVLRDHVAACQGRGQLAVYVNDHTRYAGQLRHVYSRGDWPDRPRGGRPPLDAWLDTAW